MQGGVGMKKVHAMGRPAGSSKAKKTDRPDSRGGVEGGVEGVLGGLPQVQAHPAADKNDEQERRGHRHLPTTAEQSDRQDIRAAVRRRGGSGRGGHRGGGG